MNVDGEDIWRIGFVTQQSSEEFGLKDHVTVYVPHSYAISGITYFVPKRKNQTPAIYQRRRCHEVYGFGWGDGGGVVGAIGYSV